MAKQNEDLKRKLKHKKEEERRRLDASLKQYKLKQELYGQLQEEGLKQIARDKQKAIVDDTQDRAIHEILASHQNNLKQLADSIFVAKEQNFKQEADALNAKLTEIETRRELDKLMNKKFQKRVKRFKEDEEILTSHFLTEYQKIDYMNNMYNPYYIPPISGIAALSVSNPLRKDVELMENDF